MLLPQRLSPEYYVAVAFQPSMAQELPFPVPRYTDVQLRWVMPASQQRVRSECLHETSPNGGEVPTHDSDRPNDPLGLVRLIPLDLKRPPFRRFCQQLP